ncbi:uncharacterized protein LOC143018109 [Oratosquilla oratoria]|uniref:uncharacterized protein LOC143018109 n=1 Tax=Oratosquilla oratoria TaxID=337810 RepID=UPI003F769C31
MPKIKIKYIISFSSQDPKFPADNILKESGTWLNDPSDRSGKLQMDLQLEKASVVDFIDIGNAGSAMVSLEVGRSSWPSNQPMKSLLPTVALRTPIECRSGNNTKTVRMFKQNDFSVDTCNEKWDRVRVICSQPFRKDQQFGLAFLRLHSNSEVSTASKNLVSQAKVENVNTGKAELLSVLKGPHKKKQVLSNSLQNLETSRYYKEDAPTPTTKSSSVPLSRSAQLVLATKHGPAIYERRDPTPHKDKRREQKSQNNPQRNRQPWNESEISIIEPSPAKASSKVKNPKIELEFEALQFMISLELSINEINSIKVSDLRMRFEKHRKKDLTREQRWVFKEIALDYAAKRLKEIKSSNQYNSKDSTETDPDQSKTTFQKRMEKENVENDVNIKEETKIETARGTFRFKRLNGLKKIMPTEKNKSPPKNCFPKFTKNLGTSDPQSPAATRPKVREPSTPHLPKRNVMDLDVSSSPDHTPSKRRKFKQRCLDKFIAKSSTSNIAAEPTSIDLDPELITIDGNTKPAAREDRKSLKKDLDIIDILDQNPIEESCQDQEHTTSGGHTLGKSPANKFGLQPHERSLRDGNSTSSRDEDVPQMCQECPVCQGMFSLADIGSHAALCGLMNVSDSDATDMEDNSDQTSQCPICDNYIPTEELESHASRCAEEIFG